MLIIFLIPLIALSTAAQAQEPYTFACNLYTTLSEDIDSQGKNLCFSPFSVQMGMEMAYEGAQGTTAQEISTVLDLNKNDNQRRTEKKQLFDTLNQKNLPYTLTTSNNIWIQKGFNVKKRFSLDILQTFYNTQNQSIDFAHDPRAAEQKINTTVSNQTLGHIKNILPINSLSELTRLVITNALYFKGNWQTPFEKANTKSQDFTVDKNTKITAQLMHIPHGKYRYMQNATLQMLELDYAGDALSMLILLPTDKNLHTLEKHITSENIQAWQQEFSHNTVNVYLPRFTFSTTYTLNETLKKMGIKEAFTAPSPTSGANFIGIDGKRDLYISLVAHQATVEVNEEGTVATAATAVVMNMKSMRPQPAVDFRADHPFIFLIQEKTTGTILFMGRVINPIA